MTVVNDQGAALLMAPGTGKSLCAVAIANLIKLEKKGAPLRILAVGPSAAVDVWIKEFRVHSPKEWIVDILDGPRGGKLSTSKKAAKVEKLFKESTDKDLIIASNYEAVWREGLGEVLTSITWDLVVVDEMHKMQSSTGKFALWANQKLAPRADRRIGLTGTEMGSLGPLSVFSPFQFLNARVFGTDFSSFKGRYAELDRWNGVVKWINEDDLHRRLEAISYRATKDLLDLPPFHTVDIELALGPELSKWYKRFCIDSEVIKEVEPTDQRSWIWIDVKGDSIPIKSRLSRDLRLQQILSGFVGGALPDGADDEPTPVVHLGASPKTIALEHLIDTLAGEPLVVWCRFRYEIDNLRKMCEDRGLKIGEVSGRSKDGLFEASMAPGLNVVICQMASGAAGIDLTAARHCVYYTKDFSLYNIEQSRDRLHRPGQTDNVIYHNLLVTETGADHSMDLMVEMSIARKQKLANWYRDKGNELNYTMKDLQRDREEGSAGDA